MNEEYPIDERYRVLPIAESDITEEDVLALWQRETGIAEADARKRVHEVQLVAVNADGHLAGISTAYVQRSRPLGMDLWHYRTYVAVDERHGNLMARLALAVRDLLEERFVEGEDTRASGMAYEVENQGLKSYFNRALWLPLDAQFIGENKQGAHLRVRYFPGARAPLPS